MKKKLYKTFFTLLFFIISVVVACKKQDDQGPDSAGFSSFFSCSEVSSALSSYITSATVSYASSVLPGSSSFSLYSCSSSSSAAGSNTIIWNMNDLYGVTQPGFTAVISDARTLFSTNPDVWLIVTIDAGTYNIGGNDSHGINLHDGMEPGPDGRLVFKGAGREQTTLIFTDKDEREIHGFNVFRTTFR
ncbi:MAG TPA: hypothetical protein VKS21_09770, partial [Spirochaetota bacterium]|nr:hypothetical protein [Spirochaetota bacterium]